MRTGSPSFIPGSNSHCSSALTASSSSPLPRLRTDSDIVSLAIGPDFNFQHCSSLHFGLACLLAVLRFELVQEPGCGDSVPDAFEIPVESPAVEADDEIKQLAFIEIAEVACVRQSVPDAFDFG